MKPKSSNDSDLMSEEENNKQSELSSTRDKHATEEEFQNFLQKVAVVEKTVKKLASSDPKDQQHGIMLADDFLRADKAKEISGIDGLKIKTNRTVINKYKENDNHDPSIQNTEVFMKNIEKDAKERAEDRKIRNERAETLKTIANGAFREKNYEKAITYYNKALEQRKDSTVLWNNRGLSYMQLGLYEKAIKDFDWALKVSNANIKALLNIAKCWKFLKNERKYEEYINMAKDNNPNFIKFVNDFKANLDSEANKTLNND